MLIFVYILQKRKGCTIAELGGNAGESKRIKLPLPRRVTFEYQAVHRELRESSSEG